MLLSLLCSHSSALTPLLSLVSREVARPLILTSEAVTLSHVLQPCQERWQGRHISHHASSTNRSSAFSEMKACDFHRTSAFASAESKVPPPPLLPHAPPPPPLLPHEAIHQRQHHCLFSRWSIIKLKFCVCQNYELSKMLHKSHNKTIHIPQC